MYLLILTRSNCQFALLSRGAVKTIRASRRLFANKPRARAFISPSGDVPPSVAPPAPPLVQSSRSKAFKVISVNSREKKLAHCRRWFSTMHRYRIEDGVHRPGSRPVRGTGCNRLRGSRAPSLLDIKRDKI